MQEGGNALLHLRPPLVAAHLRQADFHQSLPRQNQLPPPLFLVGPRPRAEQVNGVHRIAQPGLSHCQQEHLAPEVKILPHQVRHVAVKLPLPRQPAGSHELLKGAVGSLERALAGRNDEAVPVAQVFVDEKLRLCHRLVVGEARAGYALPQPLAQRLLGNVGGAFLGCLLCGVSVVNGVIQGALQVLFAQSGHPHLLPDEVLGRQAGPGLLGPQLLPLPEQEVGARGVQLHPRPGEFPLEVVHQRHLRQQDGARRDLPQVGALTNGFFQRGDFLFSDIFAVGVQFAEPGLDKRLNLVGVEVGQRRHVESGQRPGGRGASGIVQRILAHAAGDQYPRLPTAPLG